MSQEIINKALQKTLISPLTSDLLWSQFLEANSYELENLRKQFDDIKYNWDINKNDKNNLIRISESFGYTPNLVINNTISMAKREIESLPFRIREKTTYNGYKLIFQQNGFLGETFNYYWNGKKLVKSLDYDSILINLRNSNHYSPFFGITPIKNFSSMINSTDIILDYLVNGEKTYDNDNIRNYSLDQRWNPYWKLDTPYTKLPTSHVGIEYFPYTYYCTYHSSLGYASKDISEYSTNISQKNFYIPKSMKIIINDEILDTTITVDNEKEYISDSKGILNPLSYYDTNNGTIYLIFDIIPTDYEISISYDIDIFIASDYFYYLEQGMEYNRRCPIIPHTGVFLTADIAQVRGSDFYYSNEGDYTVHDLKLKAQTVSSYNKYITLSEVSKLDNAKNSEGNPSGKENYKLDDTIKWFLDTSTSATESLIKKFKYIASGNKALPISNEKYSQIFNQTYLLFAYNLNNDNNSELIRDASTNNLNCQIHGDYVKINGIIDKSLNFNGDTWAISDLQLNIDNDKNYTLGLWFNANKTPNTSIECLFDNFINISYNYNNEKIIINNNQFDCSKNTNHFLCININSSSSIATVYVDNIELGTFSISIVSTSNRIYIGIDSLLAEPFYGIIDNLWLIGKSLSEDEMSYIYNNEITVISHMGNRLNYYELSEDEIYDGDDYTLIQSYVKAMDITDEYVTLNNNDDETENYTFQTNIYPILNPYFEIKYKDNYNRDITIKSNEKGELYNLSSGEIITGNIDYENGICNLAKNTIKSKSQYKIAEPNKQTYANAYNQIIYDGTISSKWYEHYNESLPQGSQYSDEIVADEYDISTTTSVDKKSLYYADDDTSSAPKPYVWENNNDEKYYVKIENNNMVSNTYIGAYTVNGDSDETVLFSTDGRTLYPNLSNLINGTNQLHAYFDMGESTGTTLYSLLPSTSSIQVMYLDVKSAVGSVSTKSIRKYYYEIHDENTNADTTIYCYTINNGTDYYSDLSFSQQITPSSTIHQCYFNPMETPINSTQTELKLTLKEERYAYTNLTTIIYISSFSEDITSFLSEHVDIIPNTITFNYWITSNSELVKYTAVVYADGTINGYNISSGSFDYETNVLTVNFANKINSDVVTSFEYYYTLDIDTSKALILNYKSEKSIMINEIGLEDENHELMAYMTFPQIEFHSIYNNISAMFAINRA